MIDPGKAVFFIRGFNVQLEFTRGPEGGVDAVVIQQGGSRQTARKVR